MKPPLTQEEKRLFEDAQHKAHWRRWGPYLSERQWGTVREDYSENGTAWEYFPHDHARSRTYRWGEDGLLGISDNHQRLCFALALWNGKDPILKERLFGLTGNRGNHGEDVKEYYYYIDNTPTHSYMKGLYKYPQEAFPYQRLEEENDRRDRSLPEFELMETGIFDQDRYFDVFVEYAKADPSDLLIQITVFNRGPKPETLYLLPTLWFRNIWSWDPSKTKPSLHLKTVNAHEGIIATEHPTLGPMWLASEESGEVLFTDNETNYERLFNTKNPTAYVKDAFHRYVIHGEKSAVNPLQTGTKAAFYFQKIVSTNSPWVTRLRLTAHSVNRKHFGTHFEQILQKRKDEADEFYNRVTPKTLSDDAKDIQRQAFAGMLWSKQFYHYVVEKWLKGDESHRPSKNRLPGRNRDWSHLYSNDILSIPDKWEYPWFASWDQAFHCIPLAMIDLDFAKRQLLLFTREWYMHPNGQLPAYEWAFDDVNPPVHAWAAWRIYKIEKKMYGRQDSIFLERIFHKLLMNFTWWVNRKDTTGRNIFQGGFLGLDNIGVFDRSKELPTGGYLEQSDASSWMAMYCLNLLAIAIELAQTNISYEDIASKFFEHFLYIAHAMNHMGESGTSLWNEEDGFFYDNLRFPDGKSLPIKIRSMVGLIPLFAIETLELHELDKLPGFSRRFNWFLRHRPDLARNVTYQGDMGNHDRRILSIVTEKQLRRILQRMLDENEFLSPYGIRALSKYHQDHPYIFNFNNTEHRVDYEPAESSSGLFGGNSNWRGPVWMPVNFLLIESLQKFHHYFGDSFKLECPTGSGKKMNLWEISLELSNRIMSIFLKDKQGFRPIFGKNLKFQKDTHWKDWILFYEYFHGNNGSGLGASHQTGWTGLVAKILQQHGEHGKWSPKKIF